MTGTADVSRSGARPRGRLGSEDVARYGGRLATRAWQALAQGGGCPRREQVQDVVQEVYCRLLAEDGRRLAACRARGEAQVVSYLRRVVERVVIDQARRERAAKRGGGWRGRVSAETWNLADPRANPEALLLAAERRRIFLEEWNKLVAPAGQRNLRILHLALIEGRSSREIAQILGELSPSGVDTVVSRLRQHLARLGLPLPRRTQEGPRTRGSAV